MNWIDRLLRRLFRFFMIENAEGDPYMARYKLFRTPWFKVYLHHIFRSDEDLELHDHPWNFVSIVLWNGYWEVCSMSEFPGTPDWPKRIGAGSIVRHRARDAHRLVLERPAWTLVFVTGKERVWGFYGGEEGVKEWMSYSDFFDRKYGKGNWTAF